MVKFYSMPVQNPARSKAEGRPIFDDMDMCEVIIAGDKHYRPVFPAHESCVTYDRNARQDDTRTWAQRYPDEFKAFKQQSTRAISGTPVEEWPILTAAEVATLKAADIFTVEQIAEMNERNRAVLGAGARQKIAQAKAYIEQAREAAPINRLASENEELRAELARLRDEMKASV